MSTREKLIKARLSMPALAEQLKSVSPACQRAGISRTRGYEVKHASEKYGAEGLAPVARRFVALYPALTRWASRVPPFGLNFGQCRFT